MPPLLLSLLFLAACNLSPGDWFLRLRPHVSAHFRNLPERSVEPGWQKLAREHQVRITAATLQIRSIDLLAAAGTSQPFDPANPPPGFSLCHGGHCHASDGRLVAYEDVAAEASGRTTGPVIAASVAGGTWDLLAPAVPILLPCPGAPDCRSGRANITRARIDFAGIRIEGEVRDGPGTLQPIGPATFVVNLNHSNGPLSALIVPLALPADNRHDPDVAVTFALAPTVALLDEVLWAAHVVVQGHIDLNSSPQAPVTRAALNEALTRIPIAVHMQR